MQKEQLKERIETLTPLSVGVVFGKEDAWDKLQGRLDAKPKSRISPVYWWAAAALLLLLGGAVIFRQTDAAAPQVAGNTQQAAPNIIPQTPVATQNSTGTASTTTTVATPATISAETTVTIKTRPFPIAKSPLQSIAMQPLVSPIQHIDVTPIANVAVPAPIIKQPMKVVHINELNNEGYSMNAGSTVTAASYNSTLPEKMPVVHINRVIREELTIPYYNDQKAKNPINLFVFIKPAHRGDIQVASTP